MNLRIAAARQSVQQFLDATVSLTLKGSYLTHTNVPSHRRNNSYSITRHFRGGEQGFIIYPDGTALKVGSRDILWRHDFSTKKVVDRVRADSKITFGSHIFVPESRFDRFPEELAPLFKEEPEISPDAMSVFWSGRYFPTIKPGTVEAIRAALL